MLNKFYLKLHSQKVRRERMEKLWLHRPLISVPTGTKVLYLLNNTCIESETEPWTSLF